MQDFVFLYYKNVIGFPDSVKTPVRITLWRWKIMSPKQSVVRKNLTEQDSFLH